MSDARSQMPDIKETGLTFDVTVLNPKRLLFEGKAESVFLKGDMGEFELLAYHSPLISVLKEGSIIIDWRWGIPIKKGLARFLQNSLIVLVEE